ncbi:endolytic transglycosylase MltG [Streptomyces sp. JNUCC 64]
MQTKTPRRRPVRLTRRGRIVLAATGAMAVGAAVAVAVILPDGPPDTPTALVVPAGWRADQVLGAVDKALALRPGTTKKQLPTMRLALPADARGNPEGYLFPAGYPITGKSTPRSLLTDMVNTANRKFRATPVAAGANAEAPNLFQTVTIASIVQAEADNENDMGKIARVIHNRLRQDMPLQLDSTIDYARHRGTPDTADGAARPDHPYSTYTRTGLPPGPIANPGENALRAALNPPPGEWLYFVTVKPGDTRFTVEYGEHQRNVAEFNELRTRATRSASPAPASSAPTS